MNNKRPEQPLIYELVIFLCACLIVYVYVIMVVNPLANYLYKILAQ